MKKSYVLQWVLVFQRLALGTAMVFKLGVGTMGTVGAVELASLEKMSSS